MESSILDILWLSLPTFFLAYPGRLICIENINQTLWLSGFLLDSADGRIKKERSSRETLLLTTCLLSWGLTAPSSSTRILSQCQEEACYSHCSCWASVTTPLPCPPGHGTGLDTFHHSLLVPSPQSHLVTCRLFPARVLTVGKWRTS